MICSATPARLPRGRAALTTLARALRLGAVGWWHHLK